MEITKTLHVSGRKAWRRWLQKNHRREKEIWLIYYRKETGRQRIPYHEAVEEALCFGWIDSIVKRLDDERYVQKFTPRKKGSNWSERNIARAKKMIAAGLMADAGLALIDATLLQRRPGPSPAKAAGKRPIPAFIADALAGDDRARVFFDSLAPSARNLYVGWVDSAKKEETKQRRLAEMLANLRAKTKLGLK